MLGNFSFGPVGSDDPNDFSTNGYFKKSAIFWAYDFLTKELGLKIDYTTVFEGDKNVPFDNLSYEFWKNLGILDIRKAGKSDNFWGPTGDEGPCGPTTEIYIDNIEIWNLVFNEYYMDIKGNLKKLPLLGVDTGMGFERLMKSIQKTNTIFETDLFEPLRTYILDYNSDIDQRDLRIILDHLRGSVFLIADGVYPSNLERGYILRRILRKLMLKIYKYSLNKNFNILIKAVIDKFSNIYENLLNYDKIINVIYKEFAGFEKTLNRGIIKFDKIVKDNSNLGEKLFVLYSTYGLPVDISLEILRERNIPYSDKDLNDFNRLFEEHRKISKENK
jgi:alanyl-tRNA synthetase